MFEMAGSGRGLVLLLLLVVFTNQTLGQFDTTEHPGLFVQGQFETTEHPGCLFMCDIEHDF